jgi:hypothetical protein
MINEWNSLIIIALGIKGSHIKEQVWPAACCSPKPITNLGVAFGADESWTINMPYSNTKMVQDCDNELKLFDDLFFQNSKHVDAVYRTLVLAQTIFEDRKLSLVDGHSYPPTTLNMHQEV